MEKFLLKAATALILLTLIFFLGGSFINETAEVSEWAVESKQTIGGVWIFCCCIACLALGLLSYLSPHD